MVISTNWALFVSRHSHERITSTYYHRLNENNEEVINAIIHRHNSLIEFVTNYEIKLNKILYKKLKSGHTNLFKEIWNIYQNFFEGILLEIKQTKKNPRWTLDGIIPVFSTRLTGAGLLWRTTPPPTLSGVLWIINTRHIDTAVLAARRCICDQHTFSNFDQNLNSKLIFR